MSFEINVRNNIELFVVLLHVGSCAADCPCIINGTGLHWVAEAREEAKVGGSTP